MRHSFLLSHVSYAILFLRSYRMAVINLFHDPLCPPHGVGNGAYCGRNPCSAVVLRELPCREDAGGDQQHALATLVHVRSLAVSLYIRYQVQSSKCGRSERATRNIHAARQVAL